MSELNERAGPCTIRGTAAGCEAGQGNAGTAAKKAINQKQMRKASYSNGNVGFAEANETETDTDTETCSTHPGCSDRIVLFSTTVRPSASAKSSLVCTTGKLMLWYIRHWKEYVVAASSDLKETNTE